MPLIPKLCIVGSGPAGFYSALRLVNRLGTTPFEIDILEKLPVPYGLIRYGVSPDNFHIRNCTTRFEKLVQEHPNVWWLGQVELGVHITPLQLLSNYHAVILAIGAQKERQLCIPGEQATNVFSGKQWARWVNGFPGSSSLFEKVCGDRAVIIGNGNVALDVARLLLKPVESLLQTDMPYPVLQQFAHNPIRHVHIVGRRGPGHASFKPKEFRDLIQTCQAQRVQTSIHMNSYPHDKPSRVLELMKRNRQLCFEDSSKSLTLTFFKRPMEFKSVSNHLEIVFDDHSTTDANMIIKCIGYDVEPLSNRPGFYRVGWCSRGAKGDVSWTMADAYSTVDQLVDRLKPKAPMAGRKWLLEELKRKGHGWIPFDKVS